MPASAGEDVSYGDPEVRPSWSPLAPALGYTEKTVVVHSHDDLTLRIGVEQDGDFSSSSRSASIEDDRESSTDFVVCSRSLARASRFFNALLFGIFAEAQHEPDSSWTVSLADDCPESMYILLDIVHGCTDDIPSTLSLTELQDVLVQADKYDMMSLLGPWAPKWLDPNVDIGLCDDKRRLAWIAWKTGAVTLFERLAVDLAQNSRLNEQGELVGVEGFPAECNELDDTGFTDIAKRVRLQVIKNIFGLLECGIRESYFGLGSFLFTVYHPLSLDTPRECSSSLNKAMAAACRLHRLSEAGPQDMINSITLDPGSYQGSPQELRGIFQHISEIRGELCGCSQWEVENMQNEEKQWPYGDYHPLTKEQEENFQRRARDIGWSP